VTEPQPDPRLVHIEGGTGVQVGSGNQQTIHYHAATKPLWPVRVSTVPMIADCYQERAVEDILASTATTVVTGMGGVGKTQIAARHVRAWWTDLAVWVTAVDRDTIVAGYAQAARAVGQAAPTTTRSRLRGHRMNGHMPPSSKAAMVSSRTASRSTVSRVRTVVAPSPRDRRYSCARWGSKGADTDATFCGST
jgi:hypothetical protein